MPLSIHKDHICAGNELHSHIDICYNVLYPNFMNLGVCMGGGGLYVSHSVDEMLCLKLLTQF